MKRFGEVIKVKPEKFEEYKKLHNEIWPSIVQKICRILQFFIEMVIFLNILNM